MDHSVQGKEKETSVARELSDLGTSVDNYMKLLTPSAVVVNDQSLSKTGLIDPHRVKIKTEVGDRCELQQTS